MSFTSFYKNHSFVFQSKNKITTRFSQNIQIESIQHFKDFKIFYRVPYLIYENDSFWVPPFWIEIKNFFKKKNPFWTHADCQLFIVKKNNKTVGRIAAIIDFKYCKTIGENIGYFGFFECIKDFKCAFALLQTAQNWLRSKQMTIMRGPIDGRIDVGCGFLYKGHHSTPRILSTYSPKYYIVYVEKFGMKKIKDQFTYYIDLTQPLPTQLQERAQRCELSGVTIRSFNRLRTQKELDWWITLFLETFSDHWGFVPVSEAEVKTRFGIKQLRWFLDPRLFLVAEIKGTPIAYIWATPDYNQIFQKMNGRLGIFQILLFFAKQGQIKVGKLHFIGIKKEFRKQNIGSLLNYKILLEMKNRGYIGAEVGWIDEENTIAQTTIASTGAAIDKIHRVFEKNITGV